MSHNTLRVPYLLYVVRYSTTTSILYSHQNNFCHQHSKHSQGNDEGSLHVSSCYLLPLFTDCGFVNVTLLSSPYILLDAATQTYTSMCV